MSAAGQHHDGSFVNLHGTTVALGDAGVLLLGASGAGKSDLALRFLAGHGQWPCGGLRRTLVADDRTIVTRTPAGLIASSPPTIAGKLEVRGVGIVDVEMRVSVPLRLVVHLVPPQAVERLPNDDVTIDLLSCQLPLRSIAPFEISAAVKLALLLARCAGLGSFRF